jgi:AraC family transcriptional regulator
LAKIAVDNTSLHDRLALTSDRGSQKPRFLVAGNGWSIYDVLCTAGPKDRAFEEQHSQISIAVVLSGTFQYRTSTGGELMTPGSLLLGNPGESFECGHEHGAGDRCISFHYSEEFCERSAIAQKQLFRIPRIPALRALSPVVASASMLLRNDIDRELFQETAFQVLDRATRLQHELGGRKRTPSASSLARVTRVLRAIEAHPEEPHELAELAASSRLSPYHFLRCFEDLTGTTPRQYVLRTRLRRAAMRLKQESTRIIEIALGCGFGDVSNFNHAFRAEFGKSPGLYRRN